MRAFAVALACCLFGLLGAQPALAADVQIVPLSGPAKTITLESMAGREDVVDRSYTLRSADDESRQVVTGFSLGALLNEADVDVFTFSYVEIPRPGGGSLLLDNEQVRDSESFDGPPVVYADGGGAALIRPSTGPGDLNAPDAFTAAPLEITLREGQLIEVEARASEVRVDPGDPVTFTAEATRSGAGQDLAFSWAFDDGGSAAGEQVVHGFREPGSYDVVVGATAAGEETGGDDVVTVEVGEPRKNGPDRRGGGTNEADDAPDSGRSEGGGAGAGGSTGSGGIATGPPASGPAETPSAADRQPEPDRAQPPSKPSGPTIEGELLENLASATPVENPAEPAASPVARTGTPSEPGGIGLSGGMVAALLCGGLLGLGALIETERLARLVPRRA